MRAQTDDLLRLLNGVTIIIILIYSHTHAFKLGRIAGHKDIAAALVNKLPVPLVR